jgi:hypothetical protein
VPYYGGLANEAVGSEDWLARQAEGSRVPRCGPHNKSPGPANRSCRQVGSRLASPEGVQGAHLPGTSWQASSPRRGAKRGPLAPVTGPAHQIERPPTSSRYSIGGAGWPTPPRQRPCINQRVT